MEQEKKTMTWEAKSEMVKASNSDDFNAFKDIVIANLNRFDGQAWDMFFNCVELIEVNMIQHEQFYRLIQKAAKIDEAIINSDTSFRCVMRLALFETIMEDGKLFNPSLTTPN